MDFQGRNIEATAQSLQPATKFGVVGRGVIEYEGILRLYQKCAWWWLSPARVIDKFGVAGKLPEPLLLAPVLHQCNVGVCLCRSHCLKPV